MPRSRSRSTPARRAPREASRRERTGRDRQHSVPEGSRWPVRRDPLPTAALRVRKASGRRPTRRETSGTGHSEDVVIRADLSGRVAVVTGGARGIGAAISRRLAASGATVVVNYAKSEAEAKALVAEIAAAGGRAEAAQGDVSRAADVDALFAGVLERHGRLDVL